MLSTNLEQCLLDTSIGRTSVVMLCAYIVRYLTILVVTLYTLPAQKRKTPHEAINLIGNLLRPAN